MKLRIMIYHVPTKYKIQGVQSPCNLHQGASPWTPANTSLTECPSHNSKLNDAHA